MTSGATGGTGEVAPGHASRRGVLAGAGLIGLVGLAGACASGGGEGSGAAPGTVLGKTGDIPVGGGKVFADAKVVVTQPAQGEFKAFSAVCTHSGCMVGSVARGVINCPCHGSKFKIDDASVESGPAGRPLPAQQIKVDGDTITLA